MTNVPDVYSYVVARDFGFAPNPFHGSCTLATCKPGIRKSAKLGDWVVGTGTAARKRAGYLVFAMTVEEALTFTVYWSDDRFLQKKPDLQGSKKQAFGDNIYSRRAGIRGWNQLNSHHSLRDGRPNPQNTENDTQTNRVLIATDFVYWGGKGPKIPARFDICAKRGHRKNFSEETKTDLIEWIQSSGEHGYLSEPLDWVRTP